MSWHNLLCRALPWLLVAHLASATPREHVASVAQAIENEYFDEKRGKEIAAGLRDAAMSGAFDDLTDPRDLAAALTQRLKPLDAHFNVRWDDSREPAARGPRQGPMQRVRDAPPSRDTGIARVELLPGRVGLLELRQFAHVDFDTPDQPARRAIDAALTLLNEADAIIIDLRGNGGGSAAMVGYLTSAFTPRGADIYNTFHSRRGTRTESPREWYPQPRLDVPLFVLTSGRTGSAAEAFAYTVKNAKRARVIGETSGGAANPGGEFRLADGFVVFISTGSPKSPITHDNWEGKGVQPDEAVPQTTALDVAYRRALEAIVAGGSGEPPREARWALDVLEGDATRSATIVAKDYVGSYGLWTVVAREGTLTMTRGRWPALQLTPIGSDVFTVIGDPRRRVRFVRTTDQPASALEILDANGPPSRHRRADPSPALSARERL